MDFQDIKGSSFTKAFNGLVKKGSEIFTAFFRQHIKSNLVYGLKLSGILIPSVV